MLIQTPTNATQFRRSPLSSGARFSGASLGDSVSDAFETIGISMLFSRDTEVYGEEEPVEHFYQVVSGAVRTYKVLSDGRRQIGAFHLPGDLFGLEAGATHAFSAEAVVNSSVRIAARSALENMAARDLNLARQMWARTAEKLQQAEGHMLLLGRKTAEERVASFLLEMSERVHNASMVELPMSRQDIADYLGLTIETVSRTFTQLESKAAIELPSSRRIALRNRGALQRLNS
jgi:CRP/FNR family nitrogen fixation transcriptional regulator